MCGRVHECTGSGQLGTHSKGNFEGRISVTQMMQEQRDDLKRQLGSGNWSG